MSSSRTDRDAAYRAHAEAHFLGSAETKQRFAAESADQLVTVAQWLAESFQAGGKLMLCGNGGSAADCQHIAAEFVSVLSQDFDRRALPALALTTDTSYLTARTNDYGFDDVFSRQVEALGKPGDVLFGFSTSGNSKNVLRAFAAARQLQVRTVGFTGAGGGQMFEAADMVLQAPSDTVQHIQECHITMGHVIVAIAEKYLFT